MANKMRLLLTSLMILLALAVCVFVFAACSSDKAHPERDDEELQDTEEVSKAEKPLNVVVYLDLSDRVIKGKGAQGDSQLDRDTAIISHIEDIFIKDCFNGGKLLKCKNSFRVVFYPTPSAAGISAMAKDLKVDLSSASPKDKKLLLLDMKEKFNKSLSSIYTATIADQHWMGSDIWGFFSNRKIDSLCMRKGYRNIIVILTDGYLFHRNNKIKEGNAYSYILDQTLAQKESSLIVRRPDELKDLEVLMLEINPTNPQIGPKMVQVLNAWFDGMGVEHFVVAETDLPINVEPIIDSFFNE